MSAFIKRLLACSVGPLKSCLRISFLAIIIYYEGLLLVQISSPGDLPILRSREGGGICPLPLSLPSKSQRSPYEGLTEFRQNSIFRQNSTIFRQNSPIFRRSLRYETKTCWIFNARIMISTLFANNNLDFCRKCTIFSYISSTLDNLLLKHHEMHE